MKISYLLFSIFSVFVFNGCYTFTGISIPADVFTFYVETFDNQTANSPQNLREIFTEALKDKIRNESRLVLTDTDPDIVFSGAITTYDVSFEAPKPGEETAFKRLTIVVNVDFTNNKNEELNWKSKFNYFNNFENDEELVDVQDELIDNINEQLVEDIFNKSFTNW